MFFMKNNYTHLPKLVRMAITLLPISSVSGLIEDGCILRISLAFCLLLYFGLFEVLYGKKIWSHSETQWEREWCIYSLFR